MPPSSTINWEALVSTSLINFQKKLIDNIATSNSFLYFIMKKNKGGYQKVDTLGYQAGFTLMYELGQADSYSGYDLLPTTPMDGITTALFDWRQAAVAITISGREKKLNAGETQIIDLLDGKIKQAELGIKQFFNQRFLIGAGGSTITTPYTSALNGSSFIDPLPLLVKYDPTTSTTIGNINQLTYSWWRNQTANSTSTTFAGFLKELRTLYNNCSKGSGGEPDLFLTDQGSFELYEAALAAAHRNPSYERADIPFENIKFRKGVVTWDEFVPNVQGDSATQSTTSGTWWMLNTQYFGIKVHSGTNFQPTKAKEPIDQDATVQHILWLGAACVSNRRKQGVMGGIDTTIAA